MISEALFEGKSRKPIDKPQFLFVDSIQTSDDILFVGEYKWLHLISRHYLFLFNMGRSYPFTYFQLVSIPRHMNWPLTKAQDGVLLNRFSFHGDFPTSTDKHVL